MLIPYYQLIIVPKIIIFYRFSEDAQRIFSLSKKYKPALSLPLISLSKCVHRTKGYVFQYCYLSVTLRFSFPQILSCISVSRLRRIIGISMDIREQTQSQQLIPRKQLLFYWCFISQKILQNAVIAFSPFYQCFISTECR